MTKGEELVHQPYGGSGGSCGSNGVHWFFSDFLDGYQQSLLREWQRHLTTEISFYGGYEDTEKKDGIFLSSFFAGTEEGRLSH